MDHVSSNEEHIVQGRSNNKLMPECSIFQVHCNVSSDSEKLFLEESQSISDNSALDSERISNVSDLNNVSYLKENNLKKDLNDSDKIHESPNELETEINSRKPDILENMPLLSERSPDEDMSEEKDSKKNNELDNVMDEAQNLEIIADEEMKDKSNENIDSLPDKNDLYTATSTDTFTSSSSVTSILSSASVEIAHIQPSSLNTSINEHETTNSELRIVDHEANSSCGDENINNSDESLSRKRKLINDITTDLSTKIKKMPDCPDSLKTVNQLSGLSFVDTDSCNSTDVEIPENSLEINESFNKVQYNGTDIKDNVFLNTSENYPLDKEDNDVVINISDRNTPDLQLKHDSLYMNNSGGMNNDVDLTPTFELTTRIDEHNDIVSLTIMRTDRKYLDYNADWSQNSSPSSVTSTGAYQLIDNKRFSTMSSSTTSSGYSTKTMDNFIMPAVPLKKSSIHKHGIRGHKELFRLVRDIFKTVLASPSSCDSMNLSNDKLCTDIKETEDIAKTLITDSEQNNKEDIVNLHSSPDEILENPYEIINSPEMITDEVSDNITRPMTPRTKQIRKGIRTRPASPRMKPTILEEEIEQDSRIGNRVLARWVDKKYYAGRIVQVKDSNKFVIRFDDNHTKTLMDEYIIFGEQDILPLQGQSVYVILESDQDYEPAIVTSIANEKDGTSYIIETDTGITNAVSASELCLTEDQARAIKEIQTAEPDSVNSAKRGSLIDVNLENIIQGPRSRRQLTPSKSLTPKAGSSGLNKRRHVGRGKIRHISESSDKSVTEPASPASTVENEESSSKAPIEEVQGVEPEVQKTPKKIPGALTGPFPVKGCGRLSGRRTSKVVGSLYDNSDPETVQLLGPIPESTIFKNRHFLLTCTEDVPLHTKLKRLASYEANSGTDSEYSTDTDNCNVPFVKERLKCQLETGGGTVYSHFEEVPQNKYRNCILVAPRPCHTAKYIQCLATNIKAVLHTWVVDCCKKNKLLAEYDLPAGWSIERKSFVRYDIGKELYKRLSNNPFHNFLILLCSDNANFLKFWGRVCKSAGASIKTIDNEDVDISVGSVIVTDSDCPLKVRKQAQSLEIPLVSTTWVVQSLIVGQVCNYDNNIKYAHNYVDTD